MSRELEVTRNQQAYLRKKQRYFIGEITVPF